MNPHIPKGVSTLGVGVPMDSQNFRGKFQGSKLNGLKSYLYHWKALGTKMSKMGSHDPFEHLKHKLWPKEGSEVKLVIWLPTTKSWELTQFSYVQVACNIPLESFWRGLQLCFRPHLNQSSKAPKLRESQLWQFWDSHLGVLGLWMWALWRGP